MLIHHDNQLSACESAQPAQDEILLPAIFQIYHNLQLLKGTPLKQSVAYVKTTTSSGVSSSQEQTD